MSIVLVIIWMIGSLLGYLCQKKYITMEFREWTKSDMMVTVIYSLILSWGNAVFHVILMSIHENDKSDR